MFPSKNQSQPIGKHMAADMNGFTQSCQKSWPGGSVAGGDTKMLDILSEQVPCFTAFGCYRYSCRNYKCMQDMHGCINQPRLAMQVKNKLVEKNKNWFSDGESENVCNMISNAGHTTASQNAPKDCLSMHQPIRQHMQTRNSEPQYSDSSMESLSSVEYDAPYDHMFHQSGL